MPEQPRGHTLTAMDTPQPAQPMPSRPSLRERVDASRRRYLFAKGQEILRDAVAREPDCDYHLNLDPVEPAKRVIIRTVNGKLCIEVGEVL